VDNEREEIDRGYSGRFSSNMGFKVDFDEYQGEEFSYEPRDSMNNSIMRFNKDECPPTVEPVNLELKD
jgi:hypothetical protein